MLTVNQLTGPKNQDRS